MCIMEKLRAFTMLMCTIIGDRYISAMKPRSCGKPWPLLGRIFSMYKQTSSIILYSKTTTAVQ